MASLSELGQIGLTPPAADALSRAHYSPRDLLAPHAHGDWGDLPPENRRANDAAVLSGAPLTSTYTLPDGTRVSVVTAAADGQGRRSGTLIRLKADWWAG